MTLVGEVLTEIAESFGDGILAKSKVYTLVDIGRVLQNKGNYDDAESYLNIHVFVPLKKPIGLMNMQVDGRGFANHSQLESGLFVPEWVAEESGLPFHPYQYHVDMVLNIKRI
jgi:hypothetical protein